MGKLLAALLHLQKVERDISDVRRRLRTRKYAVTLQERKIQEAQEELRQVEEASRTKRRKADEFDLDLKAKDERVAQLRQALNAAKTNKEYASLLTQINTIKADNARNEEEELQLMQDVEGLNAQAEQIRARSEAEQTRLEDVRRSSAAEIERLEAMFADLRRQRDEATAQVPPETLALFERIAESHDGEAMAVIEVHGKKPPHQYVCGGCFMGLNPEHANALQSRDEVRQCDNCGRILYLEQKVGESAHA